ncbi:response regulator transcription factor [Thalassospira sp. MCCC 1A01428]|uniref:response regulator transcription factor n=1 Tax=Thalassospira sp. MCCC 1A01428 TaxID=1470575 RepID=UPI000A1FC1C2|nr:response regulator transcription factor [Thalassospira sp. MCCC 1A01428]
MAACIFVVEDNEDLNRDLCEYLEICGFDVVGCESGQEFHRALEDLTPTAVIFDVMLPDADGFDLARFTRNKLDCGIMMLTSLSGMDQHLAGYQSGADVYLTKDSPLSVIEAALRPLLRRVTTPGPDAANETASEGEDDCWKLDRLNWTLTSPKGGSAVLTAGERTIISVLIDANGGWLTRPDIVKALGKADTAENCRNLDTAIRRVRQKITKDTGDELPVRTAYGRGYAFTSPALIVGEEVDVDVSPVKVRSNA